MTINLITLMYLIRIAIYYKETPCILSMGPYTFQIYKRKLLYLLKIKYAEAQHDDM